MINLSPPFRPATADDADALATFINMAGEGLPFYLWSKMARPGEDPWAVGRRRAQRTEGGFSYKNAVVAEVDGRVAAGLIGYPLPETPEAIDRDATPPIFVPLLDLENLVPGTWYLNVMATDPDYRGQGYGARLLDIAEQLAAGSGSAGLSLIVLDANTGARRLYERAGYRRVADRPVVKDDWACRGENWVLLVKDA